MLINEFPLSIIMSHFFRTHNLVLLLATLSTLLSTSSGLQQYFEQSPSQNMTTPRGSSITIPCRVKNIQGECLWIHDGRGLGIIRNKYEFRRTPDNGDCSLTIHNVDLQSDNGNWQCQVTAAAVGDKTLQSDIIHLLVLIAPDRPTIRRQPPYNELQVFADQENNIECSVTNGNPAPKITWFLNGNNITEHAETIISRHQQTLAYSAVSRLNGYKIKRSENRSNLTCYSEHPTNNQADSVLINALYAPIVEVEKNHYSVMEGMDFRIECKVDANPKATVLWRRAGSNNQVGGSSRFNEAPNVLYFDKLTREDNGAMYECVATNEYGQSAPAPVGLDVLYTPRLVNVSEPQSVENHERARLHCHYEGNPKPTVRWFYINPRSGDVSGPVSMKDGNHFLSESDQVLEIRNASYSHEGEYYCEATNQINTIDYVVRSNNIQLDVYGQPSLLTTSPLGAEGRRGSQSEVSLWFCSDPPPNKVYWQFGSIRLDVTDPSVPTLGSRNGYNASLLPARYVVKPMLPLGSKRSIDSSSNCFDSTLLIKDTDLSDEREYTLFIENEKGRESGIVKLRVITPLSATLLIAIALSVIIFITLITIIALMLIRRKRKGEVMNDHEAKEDAQALSSTGRAVNGSGQHLDSRGAIEHKNGGGRNGEHHELVYANLDFEKQPVNPGAKPAPTSSQFRTKPPVAQRPSKHQLQQHQQKLASGPNGAEYAQIAFTNRAEL